MKKILGLKAAALAVPAAVAAAALIQPAVAIADPVSVNSMNVVGETYSKALAILKSQGAKAYFGGSTGSDMPQSQCIVSQQRLTSGGKMYLTLDCTQKAADDATDSQPARPVAGTPNGGPAPGAGQGTYGGPVGVPTPVGPQPGM